MSLMLGVALAMATPAAAQHDGRERDSAGQLFEFSIHLMNNRFFLMEKYSGCLWSRMLLADGNWSGEWVLDRGIPGVCGALHQRAITVIGTLQGRL
ncbi:MAG: hypothetical protein R3E02_05465 [Blastomonas sp.]